jgi:UDP-N-acetylmuramyl pentapeptide phosphotransferase/UDP-N-acetylglucosamine-1-phosphate transferase
MVPGSPFRLGAGALAVSTENRWLIVFSIVAAVVLVAGTFARRAARRDPNGDGTAGRRGLRRRAGVLLALGPLIGLAIAPSPDTLTVVAAVGAGVLAIVGVVVERTERADLLTMAATVIAAATAVIAGARFGPTGVDVLDIVFAFCFIVVVTQAADGLGNVDGLATGLGAASAAGLFALAGFGGQDDLATVALGLLASCFAFLAFNLRPASLFVGRAGRLAIGYTLAVGVLAVHVVPSAPRELVTPPMLVAVLLVDAAVVAVDRLRRRHALGAHRSDHLVHRLGALGWSAGGAVILLVLAQVVLSVIGVFTGRAVMALWLGGALAALVVLVLVVEVERAHLERDRAPGFILPVKLVIGAVVIAVIAAVAPLALVVNDAKSLMENGRAAASRGLSSAREGDAVSASASFHEASLEFTQARDKLDSPFLSGGLAIPLLAPNVRAARTLAQIGTDLANAGESVTLAVDPAALEVVDGRLPLEQIRTITPKLRDGASALARASRRLEAVRADPYLAPPVRDAVDKVHTQLAQANREAQHAAVAAQLAPAIFGGEGPRTYLLVVQNNAESRATGGFIGSYGLITALDGKLEVGDLLRTATWNSALRDLPDVTIDAPDDYRTRYTQFDPATTMQNVNLSPDFPSVAQVLMSLAPQAGLTKVDGVLAVDPLGLAALLRLTGPVDVPGWPTAINSENVVQVTLSDAYAEFAETPERADFLGDVAQVAVDAATAGSLGRPAQIAKVMGAAAHEGHLILAFARPEEQALAVELGVSGRMEPIRSDAVAVTSSNAAANKIDYYLQRSISYTVKLDPNARATAAHVAGSLDVTLDNTATAEGLPQIVIGPYDARFYAGENRALVSIYSPLQVAGTQINGKAVAVSPGTERGRRVYSLYTQIPAQSSSTVDTKLAGKVALHDGWYDVDVRHQPTLRPDRVRVSVDVPKGWRIDKAPGMDQPFAGRATATLLLDKSTTFRVHMVRDPGTWDLWARLEAGQ